MVEYEHDFNIQGHLYSLDVLVVEKTIYAKNEGFVAPLSNFKIEIRIEYFEA